MTTTTIRAEVKLRGMQVDVATGAHRSTALLALGVLVALVFTGCGAAGGQAPTVAAARVLDPLLVITTDTIPPAHVSEPYTGVRLAALSPAGTEPEWTLYAGVLPPGLTLSEDGTLAGTPTEAGVFAFTARARAGEEAVRASFALSVDRFGIFVEEGLTAGDAWADRPIRLRAVGQAGRVTFSTADPKAGSFLEIDEGAGRATFLPGPSEGQVEVISIRAEDSATGQAAKIALHVCPDPTVGFRAAFGVSDVWYVDVSRKTGNHPYASDLHAALARIGLRDPKSTSRLGSEADDLAALYVHLQLLREMNRLFHREANGPTGIGGLAISLPMEEPQGAYRKPGRGASLPGGPLHYSVLSLEWSSPRRVFATGMVDDAWNGRHENDSSDDRGNEFGIFLLNVVEYYEAAFGSEILSADPIGQADVPALRALLHEVPSPEARTEHLRHFADGFARALARVSAHEIGHGLGLGHSNPPRPDSIMNSAVYIGPWDDPAFLEEDVEQMRWVALPGQGREAGAAKPEGTALSAPSEEGELPWGDVPALLECTCSAGH